MRSTPSLPHHEGATNSLAHPACTSTSAHRFPFLMREIVLFETPYSCAIFSPRSPPASRVLMSTTWSRVSRALRPVSRWAHLRCLCDRLACSVQYAFLGL